MRVGSLFAGVGGFDLGFERAGMTTAWQVEIDAKCREVLALRFPQATQFSDIRECGKANLEPADVICGGFPCQDLSVAGKRAGMAGARSGLFYEMARIIDELRPLWVVWENVPGLLSSGGGRDFISVIRTLDGIGYGGAWTVLDARYFGLAQRRRRIFGVFTRLGSGAERAAEVLALSARLRGYPPPRSEAGASVAYALGTRSASGSDERGDGTSNLVARTLTGTMHKRHDEDTDTHIVMPALQAGSPTYERGDGSLFCVPTLVRMREGCDGGGKGPLLSEDSSLTLGQANDQTLFASAGVRRLTPVECERLQGFPDGWTDVNGLSDSHRYRQMGNAVAVPCATWIGRRLLAGREP